MPTIISKQLALRPLCVNGPIVRVLKALAPFLLPFFVGVASVQVTAPAQQAHKIKAPPRFNRRAFIAGVSLLATSGTANAITMRRLLDRGGVELTPSVAAILAREAGRNQCGDLRPAILRACNAGIDPRSPVIRHCDSYVPF